MINPAAECLIDRLRESGEAIERVDTHVSTLIFQGGWVYKVKRPVKFEFVDLSTQELRTANCWREFELNRAFAPDIYESVIPIRDAEGAEVDVALRMRRLPSDRCLATLVRSGDGGVPDQLRSVARSMAIAHGRACRGSDVDRYATPRSVERLWLRSLDDMIGFVGPVLDRATFASIAIRARNYLEGRDDLMLERVSGGHIVDGHGDLRADDIFCLDDGPRILDCLEFDEGLRCGDVLLDIAFLMMDLERLGHPELATQFGRDYCEFSGEHHPQSLLHHYIAYRALVRSKIACLQVRDDESMRIEAQQLLAMAAAHLKKAGITLVAIGGLPGSGKTTLAEQLGEAMQWSVLQSDVVRKELVGAGPGPNPQPLDSGIYRPDVTAETYEELLRRASAALRHGESVVIDASFGDATWRRNAARLAKATKALFVPMHCEAPEPLRDHRLRSRPHDVSHASDATPEIASVMAAREDPWPEANDVDASGPASRTVQSALDVLALVS